MMRPKNLIALSVATILAMGAICQGQATFHPSGAPLGTPGGSLDFSGLGFLNTGIGLSSLPTPDDRTPGTGDTGQYTISLWLQADEESFASNERWFLGQESQGIHFGLRNGGHIEHAHWGNDHAGNTVVPTFDGSSQATDDASWFHVALTYDPAALNRTDLGVDDGSGRIFVNGAFDGWDGEGASPAEKAHINTLGNLIIGARNSETNNSWNGRIDDVAIFDAELSPDVIAGIAAGTTSIADAASGGNYLHFPFDEGGGDTVSSVGPGVFDATGPTTIFIPPPPLVAIDRDPVPTPAQGPGNWNVRVIGIDTRPDGSGDGDINDHAEARAIIDYAGPFLGNWVSGGAAAGEPGAGGGPNPDEALNLNGWGIYEDNQESRSVIDFGGDNSFAGTTTYPGPDPPNLNGEDFLVVATSEEPYHFAPNTRFAINFGSDDGGLVRIEPTDGSTFVFDNEPVGSNGDAGLDNQITFNGNRGHNQTCGEFTVGPDGLTAHIEVSMHERGGGDNLELSVAEGGCLNFGDGPFQLLADDALVEGNQFLVSTNPNNIVTNRPPLEGGTPGLPCDLDGDGVCDTADLNILYADGGDIDEWLTQASADDGIEGANEHRLGDANLDGNVDSTDLGLLLNNFNAAGGTAAQWGGGDLNNSGNVDSTDLGLLLNNFNFTSAASTSAVPEPNSFVLLGIGALALLRRRRR